MPDLDWEEEYFKAQQSLAAKLGCTAHPNNIDFTLRALQYQASKGKRKREKQRVRLKKTLIKALKSKGFSAEETKNVSEDLDRIAQKLLPLPGF